MKYHVILYLKDLHVCMGFLQLWNTWLQTSLKLSTIVWKPWMMKKCIHFSMVFYKFISNSGIQLNHLLNTFQIWSTKQSANLSSNKPQSSPKFQRFSNTFNHAKSSLTSITCRLWKNWKNSTTISLHCYKITSTKQFGQLSTINNERHEHSFICQHFLSQIYFLEQ